MYISLYLILVLMLYVSILRNCELNPFYLLVYLYTVFGITYFISIPVESIINSNFHLIPGFASTLIQNLSIVILGSLNILISTKLLSSYFKRMNLPVENPFNPRLEQNLFTTIIILLSFFLIFFWNEIKYSGTYAGNVSISVENSGYKYFTVFLSLLFGLYLARLIKYWKFYWVRIILGYSLLSFWSIYSSDKNPLVIAMVSVLAGLLSSRSSLKFFLFKNRLLSVSLPLLIIPIVSIIFSLYRADAFGKFNLEIGGFAQTDAAGPMRSLYTVIEKENEFLLGTSYVNSLFTWIPEAIWSDRPEDLSVRFAKSQISNWRDGLGFGFSPLTESYLNFSYLGVLLSSFLYFLSYALSYNLWKKLVGRGLSECFVAIMGYFLVISFRGPFNYPSYFFKYFLPIVLIIALCQKIRFRF